jgi:DNA-binding LacI/PurR family transcriptional regulator
MTKLTGKRGKASRRVRLEDIAAQCGVSTATVSRALAGGPGVRPDLREKITAAARAANYGMPSSIAGSKVILAASSAAMIDYARNQFTTYVLEGVQQRALALGIEIVTRPIADAAGERRVLEEAMADEQVAGLLFLTLDDDEMLEGVRGFGKPIVLLNGDDPYMRLSSVTPCNRSAARLATDHLIALDHRRILFLMRPGRRTIERRLEGWQEALRHHGIEAAPDLVVSIDDWLPELASRAIAERIRTSGLDFTAIVAAGDSAAIGATLGVQQSGYSVPDDVAVIGIDDLPQSAFMSPPLTTMHVPMREIGGAALDLLRDDLTGMLMPPRRLELACHIVQRQSTGPVRKRPPAVPAGTTRPSP